MTARDADREAIQTVRLNIDDSLDEPEFYAAMIRVCDLAERALERDARDAMPQGGDAASNFRSWMHRRYGSTFDDEAERELRRYIQFHQASRDETVEALVAAANKFRYWPSTENRLAFFAAIDALDKGEGKA